MIRFLQYFFLLFGIYFYSQPVFSLELNAATMIANLSLNVPNLMRLATALGYLIGMFFIVKALLELRRVGESRSMMSQEHTLKGPLILLTIGVFLMWLPGTVQVGTNTLFGYSSPLSYLPDNGDSWSTLVRDCFMIIELVGTIALIRGLVMLSNLSGHGGQQGAFGKGMAHIIGGILCINMYEFTQVMINTFGLGQT